MENMILVEDIDSFIAEKPDVRVHDKINLAIEDLFDIEFPQKKDSKTKKEINDFRKEITDGNPKIWGSWFYYSWINLVVHFPPKKELRMVRTSRNRNLITEKEQQKLYNSTILVAGMSVGSNVVEALVSQGTGGKIIVVDMDVIEPSNLNRIRSPYHHVGLHKTEAINRKVNEIDPYIEIIRVDEGLNETNLPMLVTDHSVGILVDEMDELRMKLFLRKYAKEKGLPVIMAADDGDNTVLEIERFDLDSEQEILGGRIPKKIVQRIENGDMSRSQQGIVIGNYFVGFDHVPLRMFESLAEVGKTLPSWPQLGGAAALSGVSLAYVAKKIILGEKIKDGKILVSLDSHMDLEHRQEHYRDKVDNYISLMREN